MLNFVSKNDRVAWGGEKYFDHIPTKLQRIAQQSSLLIMCNLYHLDVIYSMMSYVKMGKAVIKLYFTRVMFYIYINGGPPSTLFKTGSTNEQHVGCRYILLPFVTNVIYFDILTLHSDPPMMLVR